jgi:SRSO17 transposase
VTGDEVYGADLGLRSSLHERQLGYVLAVACSHQVTTAAGPARVDALAARLPRRAWQRLPAGDGAKGQRWYDWAQITIDPGRPGQHWLLIRRSRSSGELAFYRCCAPHRVARATLVRVAGIRWSTEENFQASKGLAGLDEHQVRTWTSWHRWVTLAMLALAFLTIAAATEHTRPPPPGMIPLTRNEIAHLTATLPPPPARSHRTRWSNWRRRHQYTARACHYQRQAAHDP